MSKNPDVVAARAAVAAVRGRHHDAASLYREAVRLYRSLPDVVAARAAVAAVRGRHHNAALLYREAARLYRSVAAGMPDSLGKTLYVALADRAKNMADHQDSQTERE